MYFFNGRCKVSLCKGLAQKGVSPYIQVVLTEHQSSQALLPSREAVCLSVVGKVALCSDRMS